MSATKREDNQFLNETKLLVRNDRMPKRNKKFDELNTNVAPPQDDEITLAFKKENSLRLLNDRVAQRADNPAGDFITTSNYDPERDELLKEYNSQYPSSFEYTDEHGNKKYRKFLLPEFDVDLDPVNEAFMAPSQNIISGLQTQIRSVLQKIQNRENELVSTREKLDELLKNPNVTMAQKLHLAYAMRTYENKIDNLQKQLDKDRLEFDGLQRRKDLVEQLRKDAEKRNAVIRENNKSKIKEYADTLQLLNKGQMNTEQGPNETDEEYLTRLRRNAEIEVPSQQLEDMKFLTNQRFRKNMKGFLKNDVLIEQVINSLSDTDKNNINKRMPLFKTEFEKTFGVNNKLLDVTDILNFIRKFLEVNILKEEAPVREQYYDARNGFEEVEDDIRRRRREAENTEGFHETREHPPEPEHEYHESRHGFEEFENMRPTDIRRRLGRDEEEDFYDSAYNEDNVITPFEFNIRDMHKYFIVARKDNRTRATYKLLVSPTGQRGTFTEMRKTDFVTEPELKEFYQTMSQAFGTRNINQLAQNIGAMHQNCVIPDGQATRPRRVNGKIGFGIISDIKNQKYGQLGRYRVNLQSLYHKNFFKLYTANGDKVGKRGTIVSDLFVRLILQLVEGKIPSQEDISLLSANELHLFNWAIHVCGLKSKTSPASLKYTVNELKNRLKILEGEISVGNNNPEILKEVVNILHHLKDFGIISPKKIKQYLSQFEMY